MENDVTMYTENNVYEQETPAFETKKRNPKVLAAIVAAVVLVVSLVALLILNSPTVAATLTLKGAANGLLDRGEVKPLMNTVTGGSLQFSVDGITATYDDGYTEDVFDGKVAGKLYMSKKALMLTDFKLNVEDLALAGEAYVSRDVVYVTENKVLKGSYGVNMDTLAQDLKKSIFAPDSGSDYAMDEDVYDQLIDVLENLESNPDLEKDAKKLLKNIVKDVEKIVISNAEITSESDKVRIGGKRQNVRAITIAIDDNAMEGIIRDLYDYLCESDDIVKFIEKYEDTIIPVLGDAFDEDEYDSLVELYEEFLEEFEEEIDDICDSVSDMDTVELVLYTPKGQTKLLKVELVVEDDTIASIDFGKKGVKNSDNIELEVDGETVFTYEIKERSSKAIEAKLEFEFDGEKYTISADVDKKAEKYTIEFKSASTYSYSNYTDTYTITGKYSTKGDTTTVTVDKVTNKYGSSEMSTDVYKVKATLVMDTHDRMPKPKEDFKTIAKITEDKLDEWIEELEELDF